MPLSEQQLSDDLKRAMKAREMTSVYVLRGVVTAAKNLKVERRGAEIGEADLVQVVRKEIRKREEAEEFALKAGRQDAVDQNRSERAMLEAYAPAQLDPSALEEAIREIAADPGALTSEPAPINDKYHIPLANLVRVGWYLSPLGVVLGCVGFALWTRRGLGAGNHLIVAGSVGNAKQIGDLKRAGANAFTIGSAAFDGSYAPNMGHLLSQLAAIQADCDKAG